jgi:hypothetical protein
MKKIIYIISVVTVVFSACKKDEKITVDQGYDYFPLSAGLTLIYDVDSVVYDDFFQPVRVDTFRYQIKEVVESQFIDGQGREAWRLERYIKTDTTNWQINNVWTAVRTATTAEKVEENIRYIKLTFPVRNNRSWDGNSYNNLAFREYRFTAINEPAQVGSLGFDETVQVLQGDDENLIEKFYAEERYARHVGMVYKESINVKKAVTQQITSGLIYRMRINSYTL